MATPITHIVYADKFREKFFLEFARKEFFIGTSFPDIRYLGVIDREKTHFGKIDLENLKNEPAFLAGLKLHSLVDNIRRDFVSSNNILELFKNTKFVVESFKLLEDEFLYNEISDWQNIVSFFNDILPQEKTFEINENDIRRWHGLISSYLSKKPDDDQRREFLKNLGHSETVATEINFLVSRMKNDKKIILSLENLKYHFEENFLAKGD